MTMDSRLRTAPFGRTMAGGAMRRITSLAAAEALLLRRNPISLTTAFLGPAAMVLFIKAATPHDALGLGAGLVTMLTAFTLLLAVYYNLVTALVARREELVLKRLRTGEVSDAEILAGAAAPAVAIAWGQILVGFLAASALFGLRRPANILLILVAVLGGTLVFVLLAAASTALTRNVEMAQVTTAPVLIAPLLFSGMVIPIDRLPEPLNHLAQAMPLTPVVDLLRLGLTGATADGTVVGLAGTFGQAVVPVLVLIAWTVAGLWATGRWFRWEPRR
jgi:ABC-2 type transport system permease protein